MTKFDVIVDNIKYLTLEQLESIQEMTKVSIERKKQIDKVKILCVIVGNTPCCYFSLDNELEAIECARSIFFENIKNSKVFGNLHTKIEISTILIPKDELSNYLGDNNA